MKLKKKILAGILSGAILLSGGIALNDAQAAHFNGKGRPHFEQFDGQHERPQLTDEQILEFSQKIADYYGVDQSEVAAALSEDAHFGDIKHAATLAKLSGRSFSEVYAMKNDWHQVAEKLGVTREQFDAFMKDEMLGRLAQESKLDKNTVQKLLDDGYNPHDICAAGIIASESGKSVKNVLSKRKINNSWQDVAKEFNVDAKKLFGEHHHRPDFQRD